MSAALFHHTPSITASDSRGLTVRNVEYLRHPDSVATTRACITRHRYTAAGFLLDSCDPRLHALGRVNLEQVTDLAGQPLRTRSVDAGTRVCLHDGARRPVMTLTRIGIDADGGDELTHAITRTCHYEDDTLRGRLLSVSEQAPDAPARISERLVWGGVSAEEQGANLAGQCVRHYATDGLLRTDSVALSGVPLRVSRQLLAGADSPDVFADWQGQGPDQWDEALAAQAWPTTLSVDAFGAQLTLTDAAGHRRRTAYDVAGLPKASWLTLAGGSEQVIVKVRTWSATLSKLSEEQGNQVLTTWHYEGQTERLARIRTERPVGHPAGAGVLQDLHYEYDPLGNVLRVADEAQAIRFWRNQRVAAQTLFTYDSLCQLASAHGREMAAAGQQPLDQATYTNYQRHYRYDIAGNLTRIRHSAPATGHDFTRELVVSERSNRAVPDSLAASPSEVEALFSADGLQTLLRPGEVLDWTSRGHLATLTQVAGGLAEHYRYDGGGRRVLKISTLGNGERERTHYLPQLELRTLHSGLRAGEDLQVVLCGQAGDGQVRALHWTAGQPDGIANDALRFSYADRLGSCLLELDQDGRVTSREEYFPYGGTAAWAAPGEVEARRKTQRYSGKERDASGLYYYGLRYYQPWLGRWLSADPAGTVDGLNLFRGLRNNPGTFKDADGAIPVVPEEADQPVEPVARALMDSAQVARNAFLSGPHREITYRDPYRNEFSYVAANLDQHYRLFLGKDGPSSNLIITSHAASAPWLRDIRVPPGTKFGFYNPHGKLLLDPGISNMARGSNKVFVITDGVAFGPRKQAALEMLSQGETEKLSGSRKEGFIADYNLFRFDDDREDAVIRAMSLNRGGQSSFRFDVLTVRSRRALPAVLKMASLSGALKALVSHGFNYDAIYCSFCRGIVGGRRRTFDPAQARDI
ncbi:MAG: RHS repeat protein [Paucimonas sp.]|jgi:insecticidal toxin complex protein TccC|nr:RHS repeat protein [Paucimonas sp.]